MSRLPGHGTGVRYPAGRGTRHLGRGARGQCRSRCSMCRLDRSALIARTLSRHGMYLLHVCHLTLTGGTSSSSPPFSTGATLVSVFPSAPPPPAASLLSPAPGEPLASSADGSDALLLTSAFVTAGCDALVSFSALPVALEPSGSEGGGGGAREGAEAERREGRKASDPGEGSRKRKARTRMAETRRKSESERRNGRLARSEEGTAIAPPRRASLALGSGTNRRSERRRRQWRVVGFGGRVGGGSGPSRPRLLRWRLGGRGGGWRAGKGMVLVVLRWGGMELLVCLSLFYYYYFFFPGHEFVATPLRSRRSSVLTCQQTEMMSKFEFSVKIKSANLSSLTNRLFYGKK
ncbi:hypothetical protein SORBI_3009G170301 [Sorghum bicolor]|uniref:Uncharacterized protein n=1 Tax=Sorghum bicolor TaxID=4558 RepID=A0A1Z5R341_SORBI|nr:hypothetical protein SORBI_3009G170301 [Sorghum bicolor]